jgi:ribonuclease-3
VASGRARGRGKQESEPDLPALEAALGHAFRDRRLLVTALTHRSFAHEELEGDGDNESLEFLGDSILAFDVAERLYRLFPGLDEGRLSKHKHLLVRSTTLAEASRRIGIGGYLRLGRGERLAGGQNDKILSNAFEAMVAAVFLDSGLDAARSFIERGLKPFLDGLDGDNPVSDYKSTLQEFTQARGLGTPEYRMLEETGPDHQKWFRIIVVIGDREVGGGCGPTKRAAHQVAAQQALERLKAESELAAENREAPSA